MKTTVLIVMLALIGGTASATPRDDGERYFTDGHAAYRARQYEVALEKFRAGYAVLGDPKLLWDAGLSLKALGRYRGAYLAFRDCAITAKRVDPLLAERAERVADWLWTTYVLVEEIPFPKSNP